MIQDVKQSQESERGGLRRAWLFRMVGDPNHNTWVMAVHFRKILMLGLCALLAACGARKAPEVAAPPPVTAPQPAQPEQSFTDFLAGVRRDALAAGVRAATLEPALAGLTPDPRVIELDRKQPEFTVTFQDYIARRVTDKAIARGRARMAEAAPALGRAARLYGVEPRFVAAIWGIETNFGGYSGNMSVVRSLATLAYDGRRSAYFRKELLAALRILDEGHIDLAGFTGSWAGAMGQGQFMPTAFFARAVDADGDGKKNIWTDLDDALGSIAHYLQQGGWAYGQGWGMAVTAPAGMTPKSPGLESTDTPASCRNTLAAHSRQMTLAEWQKLGVRAADGGNLPARGIAASLVQPAGADGPSFLAFPNYRVILSYNCSNFYALAVGQIADRLGQNGDVK